MQERKCTECEAASPAGRFRRGLCSACYQRKWKTKDLPDSSGVSTLESPIDQVARLSATDSSGCLVWLGTKNSTTGYGCLSVKSRTRLAHRYVYELLVGAIPAGLQLDHLCRNRECVNPDHLEPVTARENVLRSPISLAGRNARKTHCPQGHEYVAENTYRQANGGRLCKACTKARPKAAIHHPSSVVSA